MPVCLAESGFAAREMRGAYVSLPVMKNKFESVTEERKYSMNKLVFLKIRRDFMKKRAILFGMFHYNRSTSITANDLPSTEIDVKTVEKRLKQLQFETVSYMDFLFEKYGAEDN